MQSFNINPQLVETQLVLGLLRMYVWEGTLKDLEAQNRTKQVMLLR